MKKRLIIILLTLVLGTAFLSSLVINSIINADALGSSLDLFTKANEMSISQNKTVPQVLKDYEGNDVETTFDLDKNGVLLSSAKENASIELSKKLNGSFETEFRVYSETYFHDFTGTDYNSKVTAINDYCDLREVKFTFTDENGQSFEIYLTGGELYNTITAAARVSINGNAFGYHYLNDAVKPNESSLKNSQGYYTRIGGTTFSNVTRRGGVSTTNSVPVRIGFNADTMEVYAYHYGTLKTYSEGEYRVIADLDSDDFGLNQITDFGTYNVTITFTDIAENKTANMLIYSINNQSLAGESIQNTTGPNSNAKVDKYALLNNKYYLPAPMTFDLLEDKAGYPCSVAIKDVNGTSYPLYNRNGEVITSGLYEDGCYFIPTKVVDYQLKYVATDTEGALGIPAIYTVACLETAITDFEFKGLDGNYDADIRGLNSTLLVYPITISSNLFIGDARRNALVSLYLGNEIYQGIEQMELQTLREVVLANSGNYTLVYSVPGFADLKQEFSFSVATDVPTFNLTSELKDKYALNELFTIPTGKASQADEVKTATAVLYDPNGQMVSLTNKSATLDKIGTYKLTYLVRFNQTYTYEYYFDVVHSSTNLFECEKGITATYGVIDDQFATTVAGNIITSTKNEAAATYKKVLDLSTNTKDDKLIELITIPSKKGTLDAWQYTIRLTDVYNAKNYVEITIFKGSWGNQFAYVKAGSSEQTLAGLEMNKVLTAYDTGTPINYSMTGECLIGTEICTLYYDNAEKAVYVDNIKRAGYAYGNQVIDLDDPSHFQENTLWHGFTTGEVYLSVSFEYMQDAQAQFLIKSINGLDFDNRWIEDNQKPIITIDTLNYDINALPQGEVNQPYPIYNAKAYDRVDGKLDYDVRVFKYYQTVNQVEITNNGKTFTPDEAGTYTIVYVTEDLANNISSSYVEVEVLDKLDDLVYTITEDLNNQKYYVGTYFTIPSGVVAGGSGNVDVTVSLQAPNNKMLDTTVKSVFLDQKGNYVLKYVLTDYIGSSKEIVYNLNASYSANPIIDNFAVNTTLIEGYEYDFSSFVAKDYYSKDGVVQEANKEIKITQNGVTTSLNGTTYIPQASVNGEEITIQFIAKALSGDGISVKEVKAHILKVKDGDGKLNLANLFYMYQIDDVILNEKYVEYVTTKDNASLEFANYLVADGYNLDLTVNKERNNFSQIDILLTDSENEDQQILLSIIKGSETASVSQLLINNVAGFEISSSFNQVTSYGFDIYFNAKSNAIVDGNTNKSISMLKKTLSGEDFNGFSSGKIKTLITYKGVSGESGIRVNSVSNQALTSSEVDRAKPLIQINGDLALYGEINTAFIVPSGIATDAVDPNAQISLQIKKGKQVIYNGAIAEAYQFIPNQYGVYTVEYIATDSNGRKESLTYIVTIKDRIKPELQLKGEMLTEAKVNTTYTLPEAVVTDNNDEDAQLYIFIYAPDDELRPNPLNDYSFTPTEKGEYRIVYYVEDSYNCYTYLVFKVQVK